MQSEKILTIKPVLFIYLNNNAICISTFEVFSYLLIASSIFISIFHMIITLKIQLNCSTLLNEIWFLLTLIWKTIFHLKSTLLVLYIYIYMPYISLKKPTLNCTNKLLILLFWQFLHYTPNFLLGSTAPNNRFANCYYKRIWFWHVNVESLTWTCSLYNIQEQILYNNCLYFFGTKQSTNCYVSYYSRRRPFNYSLVTYFNNNLIIWKQLQNRNQLLYTNCQLPNIC